MFVGFPVGMEYFMKPERGSELSGMGSSQAYSVIVFPVTRPQFIAPMLFSLSMGMILVNRLLLLRAMYSVHTRGLLYFLSVSIAALCLPGESLLWYVMISEFSI